MNDQKLFEQFGANGQLRLPTGTITILPVGRPHAVNAGADGLYLFAKFIPALV